MIRRPENWSALRTPAGLVLDCSEDGLEASMRYIERSRPLVRLGAVIESRVRTWMASAVVRVGQVEALVTHEGEYGALVRFEGQRASVPWSWSMAIVFGDDFYSSLESSGPRDHGDRLHDLVRSVIVTEELRLGARQRRYLFRPPPWRGLTIGESIAHYFPSEYPRVDTRLSVFPAVSLTTDRPPAVDLQRIVGEHILTTSPTADSGFTIIRREPAEPFVASSGLAGSHWRFVGQWRERPVLRDVIVLRDDDFAYAVELASHEIHPSIALDHFFAVARSIQPIPRKASRLEASTFSHWAD